MKVIFIEESRSCIGQDDDAGIIFCFCSNETFKDKCLKSLLKWVSMSFKFHHSFSGSVQIKHSKMSLWGHYWYGITCHLNIIIVPPLNTPWKQHSTKQQLYGHQPPISETIKIKRTRHTGHCWRSKDKFMGRFPIDPFTWTTIKNLSTITLYWHRMLSGGPVGSDRS